MLFSKTASLTQFHRNPVSIFSPFPHPIPLTSKDVTIRTYHNHYHSALKHLNMSLTFGELTSQHLDEMQVSMRESGLAPNSISSLNGLIILFSFTPFYLLIQVCDGVFEISLIIVRHIFRPVLLRRIVPAVHLPVSDYGLLRTATIRILVFAMQQI